MQLKALLEAIEPLHVSGRTDLEIEEIVSDSRKARPGSLFVAIPGQTDDGHRFVSETVARGAVGVVVSRSVHAPGPVTVIEVADSRRALALLAGRFFGDPSSRLRLTGVTGTNGKTTATYLIRQILRAAGRRVGLLGTVAYEIEEERRSAPNTTPDALTLQRLLAEMADRGIEEAVMEVSSHALELDRVVGCEFDAAVFTNLSQDHLDFHGTLERYFAAKERLFFELGPATRKPGPQKAVINGDDPWGRRLLTRLKAVNGKALSYGLSLSADLRAENIQADLKGLEFTVHTPSGSFPVRSPLLGNYNVWNILAAVGVGLELSIPIGAIRRGISEVPVVPGRFERVEAGQDFTLIVDYAHTEAALARLLDAVNLLSPSRILTVFGCGGDRDRGKRGPMGRAAAVRSDWIIITSDNPRSEDPNAILKEVEAGVREGLRRGGRAVGYEVIVDRREAIVRAVEKAQAGDAVVVAGKGHEDYQLIGGRRLEFDDRVVAREIIEKRIHGR
jgi:UDP-N-acetylmuramoyl-L-alanyl-D-glutamate--2,6-diaminopimelate ligase